jgi:hypothetical protein
MYLVHPRCSKISNSLSLLFHLFPAELSELIGVAKAPVIPRRAVHVRLESTTCRRQLRRVVRAGTQNTSGGSSGRHSKMGATLSKLWASIMGAFHGGANAGKSSQQHQNTTATVKDVESGTHSPARPTDAAMPEVKKYEITEVRGRCGSFTQGGMVG